MLKEFELFLLFFLTNKNWFNLWPSQSPQVPRSWSGGGPQGQNKNPQQGFAVKFFYLL